MRGELDSLQHLKNYEAKKQKRNNKQKKNLSWYFESDGGGSTILIEICNSFRFIVEFMFSWISGMIC